MNSNARRYYELSQDAQTLVEFLRHTRRVSDEVRIGGIVGLGVFLNTCTPEESVEDFEYEIQRVELLIKMDLGE